MDSPDIPTADHLQSWLPMDVLYHCLTHTQSKLIILDPERADRLGPIASKFAAGTIGLLVLEAGEGKGKWDHMVTWDDALANYKGNSQNILTNDPEIVPEDNASIVFTSGMSLANLAPSSTDDDPSFHVYQQAQPVFPKAFWPLNVNGLLM